MKTNKIFLLALLLVSTLLSNTANDSIAAPTDTTLLMRVENWYANNMNYASVTALMTIESSFIPFPSEAVVPPAAYVAQTPGGALCVSDNYIFNLFMILIFATLGSILGAVINYLLSLWLGRPIIYAFADSKVGHLMLLSSDKIKKAEDYFNKHGKISTFVGRLIPGIRQLISIPAGLAKMNFWSFLLYTFLGAFLWNTVLVVIGYVAHGQADLINKYSKELSIILVAALVVVVLYFIIKYFINKRKNK